MRLVHPEAQSVTKVASRREPSAFGHRLKLRPNYARVDFRFERRLRGKAAVAAADHVLTSDELDVSDDALGDQFRVLDDVAAVCDDSRDQNFSDRKLDVFP